jgi:hypothetical protein
MSIVLSDSIDNDSDNVTWFEVIFKIKIDKEKQHMTLDSSMEISSLCSEFAHNLPHSFISSWQSVAVEKKETEAEVLWTRVLHLCVHSLLHLHSASTHEETVMKMFKFLLLVAFLVYYPILSSSLPSLRHISEFLFTSCRLLRHPWRPLQDSIISRS